MQPESSPDRKSLTQDFDAHVPFAFSPIPSGRGGRSTVARVRRWFTIAFAESWLAILLFRVKVAARARRIPLLPHLCDITSRALFRVSIGNAVEIGPGLMLTHGNVVIDGRTSIGARCQINPWVTIGLSNSRKYGFSADGPTIGDDVHLGTGAKVLGPVTIGDYARIGANAVVVSDVPPNTTAVGVPARIVGRPQATPGDTDDTLLAVMRQAVIDRQLGRISTETLVATIESAFEHASPAQWNLHERVRPALDALRLTSGASAAESNVLAAVQELEALLSA